jgi:hypothetical protein
VQRPLHPPPSGKRLACGHEPFSNFSIGMKNGHATYSLLNYQRFSGLPILLITPNSSHCSCNRQVKDVYT